MTGSRLAPTSRSLWCVAALAVALVLPTAASARQATRDTTQSSLVWRMPMLQLNMPMLPGVMEYQPPLTPFLPGKGIDVSSLPLAQPREVHRLFDGDTLDLDARLVRRVINGRTFTMYGFNGQHPGPLIRVDQSATIVVNFTNRIDLPTTIHCHTRRRSHRRHPARSSS